MLSKYAIGPIDKTKGDCWIACKSMYWEINKNFRITSANYIPFSERDPTWIQKDFWNLGSQLHYVPPIRLKKQAVINGELWLRLLSKKRWY